MRTTVDALRHLETAVLGAEDLEGIGLRYGGFYGPGTSLGTAARWSKGSGSGSSLSWATEQA